MTTTVTARARHGRSGKRHGGKGRDGKGRDGWWPDAIGAVTWATMTVVAAMWLRGGGVSNLTGTTAGALTSLGRLAGLFSANLLLVQVFLMARVPWIERTYGQDRLARWHRLAGFASFNLLLAHLALIALGYAGADGRPLLAEAWTLVATYPGMLLATGAAATLVLVTVTSIRASRRRLRYESWHLLHLYAYVGVALSIPHELWTGADFTASALARAYWWTAYLAAAGAIVAFRVGLPLWRSLRHRLRVAEVVEELPGVTSVYLTGRRLDRLPVRGGQFFGWRFLGAPGWSRAHPYSLSAAPRPDRLRITVKHLGDGSAAVAALRPGTPVLIEGPYGRLTGAVRRRRRITLMACGIGITPMRALLESEPYGWGEATLVYRASGPGDFAFRHEIDWLARRRGVRVVYLPGRRGDAVSWLPDGHGDDVATLRRLVPDIAGSDVYVCGPGPWMDSVEAAARSAGVPAAQLHVERFSW